MAARSHQRIYYRDADICVASSAISTRDRRISLRDVEQVWRLRHRTGGRRSAVAGALLLSVAAVELSIALATRHFVAGSGVAFVAALLVVRPLARLLESATALHAIENIRRYGRSQELWARSAHVSVLLLRTDDTIRYGQVCRAMARALDDRDSMRRSSPRFGRAARPARPG